MCIDGVDTHAYPRRNSRRRERGAPDAPHSRLCESTGQLDEDDDYDHDNNTNIDHKTTTITITIIIIINNNKQGRRSVSRGPGIGRH